MSDEDWYKDKYMDSTGYICLSYNGGCRCSSKIHDFIMSEYLARFPVPGVISIMLKGS